MLEIFYIIYTVLVIGIIISASIFFPEIQESFSNVSIFLLSLIGLITNYHINEELDNLANEIEVLPLQEEPIPENIQQAALIGLKTSSQSRRLFNTVEGAPYLTSEKRSFWQQSASFFGGGVVETEEPAAAEELSFVGF